MIGIPLGKYKNFSECVRHNKFKANPKAYCGSIKNRTEGAKLRLQTAALKLKIMKTKLAAEGDPATSQSYGSPDFHHYRLKKFKKKGYPFKHEKIGILKLASKNGKFAKYYLIDGLDDNGNGWGVTDPSIDKNILSFIDRPFVVTAKSWIENSSYGNKFDHPFIPTNNLDAVLRYQEHYRVGNIQKVAKDEDGRWYCMVAISQKYQHMSLPVFCSPAIYQFDPHEPEGSITKWTGLHLAGLDENPAYGPRVAILRGTCTGDPNQCTQQLRMASLHSKTNQAVNMICPMKVMKNKKRLATLKAKFDKYRKAQRDRELEFEHPSSFVGKVTYSPELNTLEAELSGKTYGFCGVPQRIFTEFEGAPSKGAYFNRGVKGQFTC